MAPKAPSHVPEPAPSQPHQGPFPGRSAASSRGAGGGHSRKPFSSALFFGALSVASYVLLFSNERLVTSKFTMGGWNTLLPVCTALFFSFIHGAFASNLLSILGLEAKK